MSFWIPLCGFGNTGAGKSNTIARLIQEVFTKTNYSAKGARFIVLTQTESMKMHLLLLAKRIQPSMLSS